MKELTELRQELDGIDTELVRLYERRMCCVRQVAEYKLAHDMPVLDAAREERILDSRAALVQDPAFKEGARKLFSCLMAVSREEQTRLIGEAKGSC